MNKVVIASAGETFYADVAKKAFLPNVLVAHFLQRQDS